MPRHITPRSRHRWGYAAAGAALAASVLLAMPVASAAEASACSAMSTPVYQRIDARNKAQLLTPSEVEWRGATQYPTDNGIQFAASADAGNGLAGIRELWNPRTTDLVYMEEGHEADNAVIKYGYQDRGVTFYASLTPLDCTTPVYRYRNDSYHRNVVSGAERTVLEDQGWLLEGISFYASVPPDGTIPPPTTDSTTTTSVTTTAAPAPIDTEFTIAVMPDTQQEVFSGSRFTSRTQWLVDHAGADDLDLKFVTHTGDVVNWDTPSHSQYVMAADAFSTLEKAGIPYSLTIGNHDSEATGEGGKARDPGKTRTLFRDTTTFNSYFTAEKYGAVEGAFEVGKVDNIWSSFEAGGAEFMVLNLEMWPRKSVVEWAASVVAAHPRSNVIVVTHYYLDGDGSISISNDYGDTSARYMWDNLISQYANIKLVFSGHVGVVASRIDTGVHGNTIHSYLAAIHSNVTNPIRLVEIDTNGSLSSTFVAPYTQDMSWGGFQETDKIDWIR